MSIGDDVVRAFLSSDRVWKVEDGLYNVED